MPGSCRRREGRRDKVRKGQTLAVMEAGYDGTHHHRARRGVVAELMRAPGER
jgi:hypothetical protein